ncbi:hypothetical protein KKF11_03175 [Patescibacteria group bacterium]|nr:hypothetical protein [Patescibacteria group bacterium]
MFLAYLHCCEYPEISETAEERLRELGVDVRFVHAGALGDLRGRTISPFVKIEGPILDIGKRDDFVRCLAKGFCSSEGSLPELEIYFSADGTIYFCEFGVVVRIISH